MFRLFQPFDSTQDIESTSGEKCLQPEFLAAKIACSPHLTDPHCLGNSAFNACSFGIHLAKFRGLLEFSSVCQGGVACFIWANPEHFRCHCRTLLMERTRAAH